MIDVFRVSIPCRLIQVTTKNSLQDSNKTTFIELLSLEMEAIRSTEAQVAICQPTWDSIPVYLSHHQHGCQKLTS